MSRCSASLSLRASLIVLLKPPLRDDGLRIQRVYFGRFPYISAPIGTSAPRSTFGRAELFVLGDSVE
jgi:hypothetical protein